MPRLKIGNSLSMKYFGSPRSRRPYNSFSSAAPDTLETALISIKDHKELAPSDQKNILQTDVSVPEACSSKNKSIPIITQVDRINLGLTNVVSLQLHNPEAISPIPIFLPSTPSPFDLFGPLINAPIRPLSPTPIFLSSAASPFDFSDFGPLTNAPLPSLSELSELISTDRYNLCFTLVQDPLDSEKLFVSPPYSHDVNHYLDSQELISDMRNSILRSLIRHNLTCLIPYPHLKSYTLIPPLRPPDPCTWMNPPLRPPDPFTGTNLPFRLLYSGTIIDLDAMVLKRRFGKSIDNDIKTVIKLRIR